MIGCRQEPIFGFSLGGDDEMKPAPEDSEMVREMKAAVYNDLKTRYVDLRDKLSIASALDPRWEGWEETFLRLIDEASRTDDIVPKIGLHFVSTMTAAGVTSDQLWSGEALMQVQGLEKTEEGSGSDWLLWIMPLMSLEC